MFRGGGCKVEGWTEMKERVINVLYAEVENVQQCQDVI